MEGFILNIGESPTIILKIEDPSEEETQVLAASQKQYLNEEPISCKESPDEKIFMTQRSSSRWQPQEKWEVIRVERLIRPSQ